MSIMLILTFSELVAHPKNYFTRWWWPIPLVSAEQGKENKRKVKSGSIPPPPCTPHTTRSEKINIKLTVLQ